MKSRSYSNYNSSGQQIPPMVRNGSSGGRESKTSTEKVVDKTPTLNNNNIVHAGAASLKYSDDDHHHYPDEKFEEFINRVRDETRRVGTTTNTTTTTNTNPNTTTTTNTNPNTTTTTNTNPTTSTNPNTSTSTNTNTNTNPNTNTNTNTNTNPNTNTNTNTNTKTNTNTNTSTTKPAVNGLPLISAWRSVPNNPKNNNLNSTTKIYYEGPSNNNARSGQSINGKPMTMSGSTAMEFLLKEAMNMKQKKPSSFNNYNGKEKEKLFSQEMKTENIIDSREASKRCGKILSRTMTMDDDDDEVYYQGAIITSNEALIKYNGVFVPSNPSRVNDN